MSKITVERGGNYAPCSYIICKVDENGNWDKHNEEQTVLVQVDWDFPPLASNFGFVPCACGETDGTVNCPHKTASEMITEAAEYLDECEGQIVEDPGYFA